MLLTASRESQGGNKRGEREEGRRKEDIRKTKREKAGRKISKKKKKEWGERKKDGEYKGIKTTFQRKCKTKKKKIRKEMERELPKG